MTRPRALAIAVVATSTLLASAVSAAPPILLGADPFTLSHRGMVSAGIRISDSLEPIASFYIPRSHFIDGVRGLDNVPELDSTNPDEVTAPMGLQRFDHKGYLGVVKTFAAREDMGRLTHWRSSSNLLSNEFVGSSR